MEGKKYTEVYIAGKVYTLGGFEEEEYLQKIAAYVNSKVAELRGQQGYLKLSADYQNVLLHLNLADDVFKVRRQVSAAEKKLAAQEQETYHVKHDMVGLQKMLDAANSQLEAAGAMMETKDAQLEKVNAELATVHEDLAEALDQIVQLKKRLSQIENKPKIVR